MMTDTLYPTHLAHRGEGTLPVPISMLKCPDCENLFAVVCLWPQNAPSACCYCKAEMKFPEGSQAVKHIIAPSFPNPPERTHESQG
jgi:hypothetical protein